MSKPRKKYSYSKRPWWHWLIFYLIIGGIIYLALAYLGVINFNYASSGPKETQEVQYFE